MPLLLESDYRELKDQGLDHVEDEARRFLVLHRYPLPGGIYREKTCHVLVVIPPNYNQGGIDMFWTCPHLTRVDGAPIPRMNIPGGGDNRVFDGNEFCRWSRHWHHPSVAWKPGKDDIVTILRRITWALNNPDAK